MSQLGNPGNANDIWGWVDPITQDPYAILGLDTGTAFIRIADPENPIIIGYLPTHTSASLWRDIKVYNNHAYIVSEASNHGKKPDVDLESCSKTAAAFPFWTRPQHIRPLGHRLHQSSCST